MRINLKNRRLELGLSQEEVAEEADIARTTYTNIELANKNPSYDVSIRIKKVLKTTSDDIFLITNVPYGNTV